MSDTLSLYTIAAAGALGAVGLGGGIYETALIDRAWPRTPMLIQPARGGIDRKRFWIPAHGAFEVALAVAIWSTWADRLVRPWVWAALAAHLATRLWSWVYFIPKAMRFEAGETDAAEVASRAAETWVRLSRWRLPLELAALACLFVALAQWAVSTR